MSLGFNSIGHFFAAAFHDIIVGAKAVEKAGASLANNQQLVEDLTTLVSPRAASLERIAFGVFGQVAGVAAAVDTAASANGINVQFDAEMVADIKALIAAFPDVLAQAKAAFPSSKTAAPAAQPAPAGAK